MFVDIHEDMGSTNGQIGKSYLFVLKQTINLYGARVKFGRVSLDLSWPSDVAVNGGDRSYTLLKGGGAGACGAGAAARLRPYNFAAALLNDHDAMVSGGGQVHAALLQVQCFVAGAVTALLIFIPSFGTNYILLYHILLFLFRCKFCA